MKEIYIDIMDRALQAYDEERIESFINSVKKHGVREHGFPRLASNIGILMAHGRKLHLKPYFIEMMNLCCEQIPNRKAANDFSVREIILCFMELEKTDLIDSKLLSKWKEQMRHFDALKYYTVVAPIPPKRVGNWGAFSALSEYVRGKYYGIDTSAFMERQIAAQLLSFDKNGMYKDPFNPMLYELATRMLLSALLQFGYNGKYSEELLENFKKADDFTLNMQSVTGELAFGGRSNQFYLNEPLICTYCEMAALRFKAEGNLEKAQKFKAAAELAAKYLIEKLKEEPLCHVKNKYDKDSGIGCELYAYFNKYMITTASNIYMAYYFADDTIIPSKAPAEEGGIICVTSEDFHKVCINSAEYFLEFDINADFNHDANGLGRIHKKGCPSELCLSTPFAPHPFYRIENGNDGPMSLCASVGNLVGAAKRYNFIEGRATKTEARAKFSCSLDDNITVFEEYYVDKNGVTVCLSGHKNIGFMIPVLEFNGNEKSVITRGEGFVEVKYQNCNCRYSFEGKLDGYKHYYNRNGRYRVYKALANKIHIEMNRVK